MTDRQTDRPMDGQTDAMGKAIICLSTFKCVCGGGEGIISCVKFISF